MNIDELAIPDIQWDKPYTKTVLDLASEPDSIRHSIHEGGTRSGKSFSIIDRLISLSTHKSNRNHRLTISIVRKTLPALKKSVLKDFLEIIDTENIKCEVNKSELTYKIHNTLFQFWSLDNPQKARGVKQDVCFINEANELTIEDFTQLDYRTTRKMIIDFNPSGHFWAYDRLIDIPRSDVSIYRTCYKHNPFLSENTIKTIESYRLIDPERWRVYGLGLKGQISGLVFPKWIPADEASFPPDDDCIVKYGLDFGYNHPSALIKVCKYGENDLYIKEMLYATHKTPDDLIKDFKRLGIGNGSIIADCASPASIESLRRAGFRITEAHKPKGSILDGINRLKECNLYISNKSSNLIKELQNYKWVVDRDGHCTDIPIDDFNHGIDAMRYAHSQNTQSYRFL